MAERSVGSLVRWALAGLAALIGVLVLAQVIGSMVPKVVGEAGISGTDRDQLATACKLAGRVDGELCRRADRAMQAADAGQCEAARAYASPIFSVDERSSPLAQRLKETVALLLAERCPSQGELLPPRQGQER